MKLLLALLLALCTVLPVQARNPLDFHLVTLNGTESGPTLLVVGGIQGDEPGGFNAAGMLASNYTIRKGNVWVVPNLNFPSIITRSRGGHGDMNRKFAALSKDDPDYATVQRIKEIIMHPQVDVVLNLHDGSGFYRPVWESETHNPKRWGQCVIIDQTAIGAQRFGNLEDMALAAVSDANNALLIPGHTYHLKNTRTNEGDAEMEKTLTYFAITHGKPAFGVEASKEFKTATRAYYHIRVLESFMRQAGIEYERDFVLTPEGLEAAMNRNLHLAFHNGKLLLDMQDIRSVLRFVPLNRNAEREFASSKPLLTMVNNGNAYRVYYGNTHLTQLVPQYFDFDDSLNALTVLVDGKPHNATVGSIVPVGNVFEVAAPEGYRVNVIGYTHPKLTNEVDIPIRKTDFLPGYSVDNAETHYRVEVYRGEKFAGMVMVRFDEAAAAALNNNAAPHGEDGIAEQGLAGNGADSNDTLGW